MSVRLSPEELKWTQDTIKKMDNIPTKKKIVEMESAKEYKRIFGRKVSPEGLYSRLRGHAIKMGLCVKSTKGNKNPNKVFENSKFLIYVKNQGIFGQDDITGVEEFIKNSGIIGNVAVFKRAEISVKYNIKID